MTWLKTLNSKVINHEISKDDGVLSGQGLTRTSSCLIIKNKKIIWKLSCVSDHFIKSDSEFFFPVAVTVVLG